MLYYISILNYFIVTDKDKCRDHDHLTGEYRGACHNICNLSLRYKVNVSNQQFYAPVFFHNLRNYDGHLLISGIEEGMEVSIIPCNMERYLSMTIEKIRFVDSYQFLAASLDKLASLLPREKFVNIRNYTQGDNDKTQLLLRKGVNLLLYLLVYLNKYFIKLIIYLLFKIYIYT